MNSYSAIRRICSLVDPRAEARVKHFRSSLISAIPRWPNNKDSLDYLKKTHISELLVIYINWATRSIPERPRKVSLERYLAFNPAWGANFKGVNIILEKARNGGDLSAHLSLLRNKRGFIPSFLLQQNPELDRWADKDFMLTRTDWYHFHLGTKIEKRGHIDRTDYLLFAEVTRDEFRVIDLFNHRVFDYASPEYARLDHIFRIRRSALSPPGSFFMEPGVMSSGHSVRVVAYAQACSRYIEYVNERLEDRDYVKQLFLNVPEREPSAVNFEWTMNGLDLNLFEKKSSTMFNILFGWV